MRMAWLYVVWIIGMIILFYVFIGIPGKERIYESGIITDKWIKQKSALGSYTVYTFEIDNNRTVNVEDLIYYNKNIGDSYSWNYTQFIFIKP